MPNSSSNSVAGGAAFLVLGLDHNLFLILEIEIILYQIIKYISQKTLGVA